MLVLVCSESLIPSPFLSPGWFPIRRSQLEAVELARSLALVGTLGYQSSALGALRLSYD